MKETDNLPISIIIVDDHRLFNDGLQNMLSSDPSLHIIAQIYDSREAEFKVKELRPDVLLIDFNMPHINGIALTNLLLKINPSTKIITLSMYNEERHIEAFRKAGARAFLCKTVTKEEVIFAIKTVHEGELYFPLQNKHGKLHADDTFIQKLKLSNRELEVVHLIKQGMKTKEIAEKLNISYYTAETHRKNIKLKIGLKGGAEFVKFIFES